MKTPVECFTLKPVHCQSVAAIKEFQGENKWFLFYIQIYIPYTKKKIYIQMASISIYSVSVVEKYH